MKAAGLVWLSIFPWAASAGALDPTLHLFDETFGDVPKAEATVQSTETLQKRSRAERWSTLGLWVAAEARLAELRRAAERGTCTEKQTRELRELDQGLKERRQKFQERCLSSVPLPSFCGSDPQRAHQAKAAIESLAQLLSNCLDPVGEKEAPADREWSGQAQLGGAYVVEERGTDDPFGQVQSFGRLELRHEPLDERNFFSWQAQADTGARRKGSALYQEHGLLGQARWNFGESQVRVGSLWNLHDLDQNPSAPDERGRLQNLGAEVALGWGALEGSYALQKRSTTDSTYAGVRQLVQLEENSRARGHFGIEGEFFAADSLALMPSWQSLRLFYALQSRSESGTQWQLRLHLEERRDGGGLSRLFPGLRLVLGSPELSLFMWKSESDLNPEKSSVGVSVEAQSRETFWSASAFELRSAFFIDHQWQHFLSRARLEAIWLQNLGAPGGSRRELQLAAEWAPAWSIWRGSESRAVHWGARFRFEQKAPLAGTALPVAGSVQSKLWNFPFTGYRQAFAGTELSCEF